jgi:hypothetical protein
MKNNYSFAQKVVYKGKMQSYQLYGNPGHKQKMVYEKDEFNAQQNFLYKRVLFGLSVYSPEELAKMHWDKKKRIQKVHERAQNVLNIWKHQLTNQWTADLLGNLFWNSSFVKEYSEKFVNDIDPTYISNLEFKSLGVSKKEVINKLIEEKVLPYNFYQLK